MSRLRAWWPLWVLALVPLIPLWRAVFLGEAIGPWDQIRQMAPWGGPVPSQPWDVLQADAVLQFAPWRSLVLESWGNGQIPFWNPYSLSGTPLLANSQSGALYPPHILMGVLHVPLAPALTLLAWFHLFVAGLGVFALCRRLGADESPSVLAGALFGTSTFLVAWTALPSVVATCAWIPWVLAGVTDVAVNGWHRRIPALAVPTALMLLAGHLQFAAYGLLAAVLWALWRSPREWLVLFSVAWGLALGACLAAPQLLPTLDFGQYSHRRNAPTEEGYQAYVSGALQPYHALGLAFPPLLGMPTEGVAVGPEGDEQTLSGFWPTLTQRGANFAESAIGVGPVAIALLFGLGMLVMRGARWTGAVALAVLGLLLAFGSPLDRLLYFYAPGWSATGSPGRGGVLFVLAACVLAGLVADTRPSKGDRPALGALAGLVLALLGSLYALKFAVPGLGSWLPESDGLVGAVAAASTAPWMPAAVLAALAAGVGVWFWSRGADPARSLLPAALVGVVLMGGTTLLRTSPSSDLSLADPPTGRIAVVNEDWPLLVAAPALLPPNTGVLSRIREFAGYDSLMHRDTAAMLQEAVGENPAPPANGNMMLVKPGVDRKALADAGVEEIWTRQERPEWGAATDSEGFFRHRVEGPGRISSTGGPVEVMEEGPGALHLKAAGPGTLTVRERNLPGWSVWVDSREAPVPEGRWIVVPLEAGDHYVRIEYRPPGWTNGLWLLLAVGAATVLEALFFLWKQRGVVE